MLRRFTRLSIVLALFLILGVACAPAATPTPSPTPLPQAQFPLTVVDSNGNPVAIEEPPQRIIAFDSAAVEILFALGEGDKIVGTHDFVHYPAETADIPRVGDAFGLNLEKVADLQPDLFYIFFEPPIAEVEKLGIKVLYLQEPATLEELPQRMRLWGRITGKVAEAERLAAEMEGRLKVLEDRVAAVDRGPRIFHDVGELWTPGPDTFQGRLYTFLKAQNIAHDVEGWAPLSAEVVVERDPQVIVTTYPDGPQVIQDTPAFQSVSAVKEGRVYSMDADLVDIPGPRVVQGLEELARLLYPQLSP